VYYTCNLSVPILPSVPYILAPQTKRELSVPVTARLSKRFYEQLGDEIANELVDWFNQVETTYRSDLRELNELNFARFDAKVEQRFVESEARVEKRFVESEARVEKRLVEFQMHVEKRLGDMDARIGALESVLDRKLAEQREFLERRLGEQTRGYYAAWAVQVAAAVAVLVRVYLG
jgi:hypothetical protein